MGVGKTKLTKKDVGRFLESRPYSDSTRNYYGYMLRSLSDKLKDSDLTADSVKKYANCRYPKKSSRNTFLQIVKSFADWKKMNISADDPNSDIKLRQLKLIRKIHPEKVEEKLEREVLSYDELLTIFRSADGTRFAGLWSLAWLGCRPRELTALSLKNINRKKNLVIMNTERRRVKRELFLNDFAMEQLEEFVRSEYGYQYLYNACRSLRDRVELCLSPRSFRKTFETKMHQRLAEADFHSVRIDILIKFAMGHTVGNIFGIYRDAIRELRKAFLKHHYLHEIEESLGLYPKQIQ